MARGNLCWNVIINSNGFPVRKLFVLEYTIHEILTDIVVYVESLNGVESEGGGSNVI